MYNFMSFLLKKKYGILLLKPQILSLTLARWANEDVRFYLLAWHFSEPAFTKFSNCRSVTSACWDLMSLMFYIFYLKTYFKI